MSPADELRAAATRLQEAAAQIGDAAPWTARNADPDFDNGWTLDAPPPPGAPRGVSWFVADELPESTARWASMLGPQVASPLAELLRAAAEMQDIADGAYETTRDRALALLGPEPPRPPLAPNVRRALAVAHSINGVAS